MSNEEKVLTIKDGEIKDASIEDALMLLDVAPKIWGFDNEGIFLSAYNFSVEMIRKDIREHEKLKVKLVRMQSELFAWRVCWAIFGVFLFAVGLIGILWK